MSTITYEIVAEAQRFVRGMSEAQRSAMGYDTSLKALARQGVILTADFREQLEHLALLKKQYAEDAIVVGQLAQREEALARSMQEAERAATRLDVATVKLNASNRLISASTGQYVSVAAVRASAEQKLAQMGVITTAQMQREIQTLNVLMRAHADDAMVVQQLAIRKQQLAGQMALVNRGMAQTAAGGGTAQNIMFNLGQIVEDSQYGWRAVGNNINFVVQQMAFMRQTLPQGTSLLRGLAMSFTGAGGIVLGISAAVTLLPKLISWLNKTGEAADEARKRLNAVAESMISLKGEFARFEIDGAQAAITLASINEELIKNRALIRQSQLMDLGRVEFDPAVKEAAQAAKETNKVLVAREALYRGLLDKYNDAAIFEKEALARGHERVETEKKTGRTAKERETLLQREISNTAELRAQVRDLAAGGALRLANIEAQNRNLQKQIALYRSMGQAQAGLMRLDPRSGVPINQDRLSEQNLIDEANSAGLRTLGDTAAEEAQRMQDAFVSANRNIEASFNSWLFGTQEGLEVLSAIAQTTFGGFAALAKQAYQSSGNEAKAYFELYKAIATAEALVNTYVAATKAATAAPWPLNAFLVAGALAQGAALIAGIHSASPGSSSVSAGGGGGGGRGLAIFNSGGGGAGRPRDLAAASEVSALAHTIQDTNAVNRQLAGEISTLRTRGFSQPRDLAAASEVSALAHTIQDTNAVNRQLAGEISTLRTRGFSQPRDLAASSEFSALAHTIQDTNAVNRQLAGEISTLRTRGFSQPRDLAASSEFSALAHTIQDTNAVNRQLAGEIYALRVHGVSAHFGPATHRAAVRETAFRDELTGTRA